MCVASIAWDAHPDWLLVAIGNRDEFHEREAAPLSAWDGNGILAGRDLRAGGTWLGVSDQGRFALVTNYRVPEGPQPGRPSRGALVTDLLEGKSPEGTAQMNPFNLVYADASTAQFLTNYPYECRTLEPGIYGMSNGAFDRPWPKTLQLNADLEAWLDSGTSDPKTLFTALMAESPEPGAVHEGEGPESVYAPVFIRHPVYGTRCSTVITIARDGRGRITERSYSPGGEPTRQVAIDFDWPT